MVLFIYNEILPNHILTFASKLMKLSKIRQTQKEKYEYINTWRQNITNVWMSFHLLHTYTVLLFYHTYNNKSFIFHFLVIVINSTLYEYPCFYKKKSTHIVSAPAQEVNWELCWKYSCRFNVLKEKKMPNRSTYIHERSPSEMTEIYYFIN